MAATIRVIIGIMVLIMPPAHAQTELRMFASIAGTEARPVITEHSFVVETNLPIEFRQIQAGEGVPVIGLKANASLGPWLVAEVTAMASASTRQVHPATERMFAHGTTHAAILEDAPARLTNSTAVIMTAAAHRRLTPGLGVYGRFGAVRVQRLSIASHGNGATFRIRDSEVRPWIGIGFRFDAFGSLTLTADHGGASNDFQTSRIGLLYSF